MNGKIVYIVTKSIAAAIFSSIVTSIATPVVADFFKLDINKKATTAAKNVEAEAKKSTVSDKDIDDDDIDEGDMLFTEV